MDYQKLEVGDLLPEINIERMTQEQVQEYGLASKDTNPIHKDEQAAQQAGFPNCVVQGMLTMGISTRFLTPWIDQAFIKSSEAVFHNPLFVGDSLLLQAEVKEKSENKCLITFKGQNQHSVRVISGEFLIEFK